MCRHFTIAFDLVFCSFWFISRVMRSRERSSKMRRRVVQSYNWSDTNQAVNIEIRVFLVSLRLSTGWLGVGFL